LVYDHLTAWCVMTVYDSLFFDKSNSKGLASNRIRCLYEDKSGTL